MGERGRETMVADAPRRAPHCLAHSPAWIILCIVWSSTWLAIKFGLRDLPPLSFVAWRFVIAVVALLAVSIGRENLLPRHRFDLAVLAFSGVLMFAINYALVFWGELHVSSGLAAVIQASIPILGWSSRT